MFPDKTVIPPTEAPSAQAVGGIGIGMLVGIVVAAAIMDIPSFMEIIQRWKEMLK